MSLHNILHKLKVYWSYLDGKRTYLIGSLTTLLNVFVVLYPSALSQADLIKLDGILVALGGMAIRSSISKLE